MDRQSSHSDPPRGPASFLWRALAILLWCFSPLVGLVCGWYLAALIGVSLFPGSNLGPLPFILTVVPLTFAVSTGLGVALGMKAWKKGKNPAQAGS
jgi:hypothetical protein